MAEYIVLCGQIVGNQERGFETVYGWEGERFASRAVLENGKLVSLDWMEKPVDTNRAEMRTIAKQLGLPA